MGNSLPEHTLHEHKHEYDKNGNYTGYKYNSYGEKYKSPQEARLNRVGASTAYKPGYKYDTMARCWKGPNYKPSCY